MFQITWESEIVEIPMTETRDVSLDPSYVPVLQSPPTNAELERVLALS
jgi:hypothetical protein